MRNVLFASVALSAVAYAQNPLMDAVRPRYETMRQNLVESAEAMPADQYGFRLSPQQRPFGEWINHTVMLLHNSCATMAGGAPPAMDHTKHSGDQSKAGLVQALKEAAAGCDTVMKDMTDQKILAQPKAVNAMIGLLTNMASHYGNMVGYLRAKNIVPPSTARAAKK